MIVPVREQLDFWLATMLAYSQCDLGKVRKENKLNCHSPVELHFDGCQQIFKITTLTISELGFEEE